MGEWYHFMLWRQIHIGLKYVQIRPIVWELFENTNWLYVCVLQSLKRERKEKIIDRVEICLKYMYIYIFCRMADRPMDQMNYIKSFCTKYFSSLFWKAAEIFTSPPNRLTYGIIKWRNIFQRQRKTSADKSFWQIQLQIILV